MISPYIKQVFRSLSKNRSHAFLNIIALSASLTCFTFIAVWVYDELSYDKFNKNYDRIFRLTSVEKTASGITESAVSSAPMAAALKSDYPEVEQTVRLRMREDLIDYNGRQFLQSGILLTDPSFFEVFSFHLTKGNAATALSEPFSIVLTESTAKKYFGDKDPIGQSLTIYMYDSTNRGVSYTITGILPDPPKNAHFTFNMLASFKTVEFVDPDVLTTDGWGDASFYTYVLLKNGIDHRSFSKKIELFYRKYIGELFQVWRNIYSYKLQPLSDIHLRSHLQYEIDAVGNINNVYIFSTVGIFILLLAGINYVNLSTARSLNRAKEVSIKKVAGAGRGQLILQYLLESLVTVFIAFGLSLLFCLLLKPLFSDITAKDISPLSSPLLLSFIALVSVVLGLLSGIYPAFIISGFKPMQTLKGSFSSGTKGSLLRKTLVTAQFTITLVLIIGIIVVYSQLAYIQNKDLGYKKEGLVVLKVNGNTDVINGFESFKNDLEANPLVSGTTTSNSLIVSGLASGVSQTTDENGAPLQVNTALLRVDEKYFSLYGIPLLAGKNFNKRKNTDSINPIIINQSALTKFGWKNPEVAIGKPFTMGTQKGMVIGVIKDFHFNSLHKAIQPLAVLPVQARFSRITVRANVSNASQLIGFLSSVWKKHFPSALLDYDFVDKQVMAQYKDEQRFSKIFSIFSLLSLLIACLGLYGLIAYAASQRVKEIGIRKVLGASVGGIVFLLTSEFLRLVLLSFIIATPIALYTMSNWLQDFEYRIAIGWWVFLIAGMVVLLIAMATVAFRAMKAAVANPVKSLRAE